MSLETHTKLEDIVKLEVTILLVLSFKVSPGVLGKNIRHRCQWWLRIAKLTEYAKMQRNEFIDTIQQRRYQEIVIFLGADSGAALGNVTVKTPFSNEALICSSCKQLVRIPSLGQNGTAMFTLTP